jgi:hypothetical protein
MNLIERIRDNPGRFFFGWLIGGMPLGFLFSKRRDD